MFNRRVLDKTLASAGFPRTAPLTYAVPSSSECVTWEVGVQARSGPIQKLEFWVLACNPEASAFARLCLSQCAGHWWADSVQRNPQRFRGLASPIREFDEQMPELEMSHQECSAEETASRIVDSLRRSVVPFIATIGSERAYFDALIRATPLNWPHFHPLTRAAQVAFLGAKFGVIQGELKAH